MGLEAPDLVTNHTCHPQQRLGVLVHFMGDQNNKIFKNLKVTYMARAPRSHDKSIAAIEEMVSQEMPPILGKPAEYVKATFIT